MPIDDFPFHVIKAPGRTTAIPIGLAVGPTLDGFGLTSADGVEGAFLEHATGITTPSGGLITAFDVTSPRWEPTVEFVVKLTGSDLSDMRVWIGLFADNPDELVTPFPEDLLVAFRYQPNETRWQLFANVDGDVQQKPALQHAQLGVSRFRIEVGPSSVQFFINGSDVGSLELTTNVDLPLGIGIRVVQLDTNPRKIQWSRVSWIHKT